MLRVHRILVTVAVLLVAFAPRGSAQKAPTVEQYVSPA